MRIVLLSDRGENKPTNPDNSGNPPGAYTAARAAKDHRVPVPADDTMTRHIAALSGGQAYDTTEIDELDRSGAETAVGR